MDTSTYIDLLIKKYSQTPSFPFDDWTISPVSFYALINLWDELFNTAAGKTSQNYAAHSDAEMDIDRLIYDVCTHDRKKRVSIHPESNGGVFNLFSKPQEDGYNPDHPQLKYFPERSSLEFATDIKRDRLIACFEIIRHYTHAEIPSVEAADALHLAYVDRHKHIFGFPDFDPFAPPDYDEDA